VSGDAALRQSTVWAALHLRANLISSFPIDTFRYGPGGIQLETQKPPVLVSPSSKVLSMREWMYSTQIDLDRFGNCFGLIRERDGAGRPARIDLVAQGDVSVLVKDDVVSYRIKGKPYAADEVWHEREYTVPGLAVGLSPIAYAAWSLSTWQSAADFALEWFTNHGVMPNAQLRNTARTLADGEADRVKGRFKVAVEGGDVFVTGKDWEFLPINASVADAKFLAAQDDADAAAARFFGVPGDLIDVATKGQSITYANITQRNLQLLIMHLSGAVARREDALSTLLPDPWFVKLNTSAILRMDPETTSRILIQEVAGKITAPSEARALMNRPPFTDEQVAEFEELGIVNQLAGGNGGGA
jgi:HK97 family phage portal protein